MESVQIWKEVLVNSFTQFGEKLMGSLPGILAALTILTLGWLFSRLVASLVRKFLEKANMHRLNKGLVNTELFSNDISRFKFSHLIARFVYWTLMFIFIITATETLGMTVVAERLSDLVNYLPKLFAAAIIAVLGIFLANFIKNAVRSVFESFHIGGGRAISQVVFYFLLAIILLTAFDHAGIDVSIITTNLSLIIGAVALAFVISFVIGTRELIPSIALSQNNTGSVIELGQDVTIGRHRGKVVSKNKLYIELDTGSSLVLIPNKQIADAVAAASRIKSK